MKVRTTLVGMLAFCALSWVVQADDWPQWRGPHRDGISKEVGLLKEWPKQGPTMLWHITDAGGGYSTPAVVGERIYLLSTKGKEEESVQARDVKDGKVVWSTRLGKVGPNINGPQYLGARSTPTVDGDVLYALGSDGDLVCVKTSSGAEVWRKNLRKDFGGVPGKWAYAESPLVDGDRVVCTPGGKEATIVALDKKTGNPVMKSAIPGGEPAAYASIIVVPMGGAREYVQFLQNGVVGIDTKTGKLLWRFDKTATGSPANIPTPIAHDGYVYSSTGKGGGGLVKLQVDNESVTPNTVYFKKDVPTSIGGAVLLGNFLYGTNNKGLLCVEFTTGTEKWQKESIGPGSLCYADGRLYVHGENGDVALVEATPEAYREKGRFTPPDQPKDRGKPNPKAWAYPVVANGRLYIRDLGSLWCYDVKDSKDAK